MRKFLTQFFMVAAMALLLAACVSEPQVPQAPLAPLQVSFADSKWTGRIIPREEVCNRFNTRPGNAPSILVSGLPAATVTIELSFNDISARSVFNHGGHGVIHYLLPTPGANEVVIPSFPGQTSKLPGGFSVKRHFTSEAWDTGSGYLPPCSGGQGNTYTVDIRALDAQGARIAEAKLVLGAY